MMTNVVGWVTVFSGFFTGAICATAIWLFFYFYKKRLLGASQKSASLLLKETHEEVERQRKEALSKLKEELHRKRTEFDLEIKKSKIELQRLEHKQQKREDLVEQRELTIDSLRKEFQVREKEIAKRQDILNGEEIKLKRVYEELVGRLEQLSRMTREEARKYLLDSLQEEVKRECQKWIAKSEEEARLTAKEKAISIVSTAIQRYLPEQVSYHSSSTVHLPNEEMKGRIIGKEGRNIRTLEMATGMEFVIGEVPESITISGFNPIRREVARRSLLKLVQDGRINPSRIEETVSKCTAELDATIQEIGYQTTMDFGCTNIHPEINIMLGKLYFRFSYTQNNLEHSKEVASLSRMIAEEFSMDGTLAARCGLLHDIGKSISAEVEGPHALIGADFAKKYGEEMVVVNAIAAHHEEEPKKSIYAFFTHFADAISASRPGARKDTLATYIRRVEKLEEISQAFEGVKKAYALQAGREIRVIVDEDRLDDDAATSLARDIALRIESEMNFPGQIKVNVIREKRIIQYAK